MLLVTGGAGFIGSNFVLHRMNKGRGPIVNLDKLTYAGNLNNLTSVMTNPDHHFVHGDIGDRSLVRDLLRSHNPYAIVNFAAETHVDRSIYAPENFVTTNIASAFSLLDECYEYWKQLPSASQERFRFLNISTDEVYGSLSPRDPPSKENTPFTPNSPYAASKASFDHLARSYHSTYGFPVLTSHSSNNFGPFQFPEKLIPLIIVHALQGKPLPIYGDGLQIRDWIYVEDHCEALNLMLTKGIPGESYNIGHWTNLTNLDLVNAVCKILDELKPKSPYRPHASLIQYVKDRPGHDRRYALDSSKIRAELGWRPTEDFEKSLLKTVTWYLNNSDWLNNVLCGQYHDWIAAHYR